MKRLVSLILLSACTIPGSSDDDDTPPPLPCEPSQPLATPGPGSFTDISAQSGIQANNFTPNPTTPIPINDHSRLAFIDLDGDFCDDIVAHDLFPNPQAGIPYSHLVFHSNCDGTFTDMTQASGLGAIQAGFFAFGDIDNDGDEDCFAGLDIPLAGKGNQILLNDGHGHFTPKANTGIEGEIGNTTAGNAVFADFNNDAKLDLFIGNGQTSYLTPDALYYGNGDGTFSNVSAKLVGDSASPSNGSTACDYDNDGDLDIFVSVYGVSNGGAQNFLYQNDGHGTFKNVAVETGFASLPTGNYWIAATGMGTLPEPNATPGHYIGSNGFGLACEDVDGDGDMDVTVSAISHPGGDYSRTWSDPTVLLVNTGAAGGYTFENQWLQRGLPYNEGDVDAAMVDFDNDGRMDISLSRTDKYESNYTTENQKGWFGLMHQKPDGSFEVMDSLIATKAAQNHAWADIDGDGDLDLLIGGRDQGGGRANLLFRNEVGRKNHYISLAIAGDGVHVNKDGIGTRVTVKFGDGTQIVREVKSSRGTYNSMDTRVLYFGLGDRTCDYEIDVRFPDGETRTYSGIEWPPDSFEGVIQR